MEKLLHERLREWACDDSSMEPFDKMSVGIGCEVACTRKMQDEVLTKLADEIERYYIPRPRFEDGEPVQFCDDVKGCDGGVCAMLIFDDGSGQACGANDNPWDAFSGADFEHGKLKRPTQKVYDADGVEIKEGVVGFYYDGTKLRVLRVEPEIGDCCVYVRDRVTCCEYYIKPEKFTLKEPDSLEKLRDDMNYRRIEGTYPGTAHEYLCKCADRLTALMERGA